VATKAVVPLTVRLPAELHAALAALAERHDRSLHGEIVAALRASAARQADRE
jgi:predicted transcriptional regulator